MSIYEMVLLVFSILLLVLFSSLNMTVQSMKSEISNNSAMISSLSNQVEALKSTVNPVKITPSFLKYDILFQNASRTLPSLPLNTIESTNLQDFSNVLSMNEYYEITKFGDRYFLAYPAVGGSTFSIQVLSSPYSERVMKIINNLRGQNIPAFDIQYGSQYSLFVGVFPNYVVATQYASAVSEMIFSTTGATYTSWLIRQIP